MADQESPLPETTDSKKPSGIKVKSFDPEFWTALFAKSGDLFFRFMGLDPIADDIEKHHATMRKVALVRFVLIMAIIVGFFTWGIKGCRDDKEIQSLKDDLSKSQGATIEAERDRDKYQLAAQNADNALAPWKELANSQFPEKPINEGLNALLQKVESLQIDLDSKMQVASPLNQSVAVAVAEINIKWKTNSPAQEPVQGGVQMVGFGRGNLPLLIAASGGVEMLSTNEGPGWCSLSTSCQLAPSSPSGFPIAKLRDSQFIQIEFSPPNSIILGGHVRWTINSNIVLDFDIPAQTANGSHVFIRDLESGLRPLSSTPDKSASPP